MNTNCDLVCIFIVKEKAVIDMNSSNHYLFHYFLLEYHAGSILF